MGEEEIIGEQSYYERTGLFRHELKVGLGSLALAGVTEIGNLISNNEVLGSLATVFLVVGSVILARRGAYEIAANSPVDISHSHENGAV